jgi:hypothetical protein
LVWRISTVSSVVCMQGQGVEARGRNHVDTDTDR